MVCGNLYLQLVCGRPNVCGNLYLQLVCGRPIVCGNLYLQLVCGRPMVCGNLYLQLQYVADLWYVVTCTYNYGMWQTYGLW